jgi:hypothetical protein
MLIHWKQPHDATPTVGTLDDERARFSIGRLILAAGLLAAVLAIGVSSIIIHQQLGVYARMRNVIDATNQASSVATLVDQLQIERDLTALSLAGDARAVAALFRQYARTDRERGATDVTEIDRLRADLLRHSLTANDAIEGYASIIRAALAGNRAIAQPPDSNPVGARLQAYKDLTEAKERAGQERTIGSVGFVNAFVAASYQNFIARKTEQDAYLSHYLSLVSDERRQEFARLMSGSALSEFDSLRSLATPDLPARTIDAGAWFVASSRRIAILQGIEEAAAADLLATADDIGHGAMMRLAAASLGAGLAVLLMSALPLIFSGGVAPVPQPWRPTLRDWSQSYAKITRKPVNHRVHRLRLLPFLETRRPR